MGFIFKNRTNNNGAEKIYSGEILREDKLIRRQITYKILETLIIYNAEEEYYYTVATCVNENNVIETISIEGFEINKNVKELKGAYIDYEEYGENSDINCSGKIYNL